MGWLGWVLSFGGDVGFVVVGRFFRGLGFSHGWVFSLGKRAGLTDEEILGFFEEGYRFRVKLVGKKYRYVTMRLGQSEKSLGRFSDELWERVTRLSDQWLAARAEAEGKGAMDMEDSLLRHRRIARARSNLVRALGVERGIAKLRSCSHLVEGFCHFWVWEGEKLFFRFVGDTFQPGVEYKKKVGDSLEGWIFRASPDYCQYCSSYIRE
jgi:hypothetical protein